MRRKDNKKHNALKTCLTALGMFLLCMWATTARAIALVEARQCSSRVVPKATYSAHHGYEVFSEERI